jgi:hypothetical protein
MERNGIEWKGMERNGKKWNGKERNGKVWIINVNLSSSYVMPK